MSKRITLLARRPKIATKDIKAKVANAVHNLLKGIEVGQIMNTELDYEPLIDEMNELVNGFRLSVRLRIANNRRKAEEDENRLPGEDETEARTTSSYNGFGPYSLSIEPEDNEDEPWDNWDESDELDDDEFEDSVEHVEDGSEGSEMEEG